VTFVDPQFHTLASYLIFTPLSATDVHFNRVSSCVGRQTATAVNGCG